jgi:hypothetical protein
MVSTEVSSLAAHTTMLWIGGCARGRRGSCDGEAGCDGARLVTGTGGLVLPSPGARAWFLLKVIASEKASKLSAFHLVL